MTEQPTMRAVVQHELGDPSVLSVEHVPRPSPLPTEVLVRVHAAGVNPVDWKSRAGRGMPGRPPFTLGWDVAGVVEEVGFGVTTLAAGDRVFGMPWFPRPANAYAEYVTAPSRQLAKVPDSMSLTQAAAVPLAALTAWQALVDTARVEAGRTVVVTAAAGGVGHFAVQIAAHLGAHVIAVASERHHEWLSSHGADEVIDYTATPFEQEISGADVVLELVGDSTARTSTRALGVLRPGGLLIAVPSGVSPDLARAADAAGVRVTPFLVEPDGHALSTIAALIDEGAVEVEIAEILPLDQAAAAHTLGETNRTRGKIVLTVPAS